jgi:hypothetical protein
MEGWADGCCIGEPWRAECWAHKERGGVGSREGEVLAAEWCDWLALWGEQPLFVVGETGCWAR